MFSEIQVFQLLGLLFFGSGLGLLINPKLGTKLMDNIADYPMFIYLSSFLALGSGFYLVVFYNVWGWDWTTLLAVVGWAALIKGFFMLVFPGLAISWVRELRESYITIKALASTIFGFILLALGFILR